MGHPAQVTSLFRLGLQIVLSQHRQAALQLHQQLWLAAAREPHMLMTNVAGAMVPFRS